MQKRTLGRTGFEVSIVGIGGIPIQQADQETVDNLLKRAIELGINFIDTARGYTISEELIGNALAKVGRENFYIATKTMGRTYDAAKSDFETSMKNLGVDKIDLYQFHNVSKPEEYETIMSENGAYKFALEMKEKGMIREIGITSHSADMLDTFIESGKFATIQFPYNAVESQGVPHFKKAHENNIGTIAMKPIAGGVLMDYADKSLRYILENENLTLAIPGVATIEELEKNAEIGNNYVPLNDEERRELKAEADSLGNDFCRRCNYCQPCTSGIRISQMFTLNLYYTKYGLKDWAKSRYQEEEKVASDCIECGLCETRCPYNLHIIDKLKGVAEVFEA